MFRHLGISLLLAGIAVIGLEIPGHFAAPGKLDLISPAEAVVGRPLTPVSVAGVARRTARRCAVGVYYC
jgi:hypothetical protein